MGLNLRRLFAGNLLGGSRKAGLFGNSVPSITDENGDDNGRYRKLHNLQPGGTLFFCASRMSHSSLLSSECAIIGFQQQL
jgi:hypothetical protein